MAVGIAAAAGAGAAAGVEGPADEAVVLAAGVVAQPATTVVATAKTVTARVRLS
jgi:hypothetical protein